MISKKSGVLSVIFGPDPLEVTDDEIFMVPSSSDPTKLDPVDAAVSAIQNFITLKPGEYAVVSNPVENVTPENPNGAYSKGRNEMKPLKHGTKRVVTGGHFPVWPYQKVEVRKIHGLSSNQYLMVVVESEVVDDKAPYYDLTLLCASIKKAVIKETSTGNAEKDAANEAAAEGQLPESVPASVATVAVGPALKLGQRIIIPGSLTPTYIPPSGIEVVTEVGEQAEEDSESDVYPRPLDIVKAAIEQGSFSLDSLSDAGLDRSFQAIRNDLSAKGVRSSDRGALFTYLQSNLRDNEMATLASVLTRQTRSFSPLPSVKKVKEDRGKAVRQAVVLGPTEFCVLLDEDGQPQIKRGPGRVFPGPYDVFRTEGSRNRVYDAYHLRSDRGILLRVIADSISKSELTTQLPEGAKLEKDKCGKGDEIFISGVDAYLVPSNSFEVIDPSTRQPHIGNDHSSVYVQAIGVDQKSGVYVASVDTGNVELVHGEKKLLLDPRRQRHIKRRIPARMWNLIIGKGEPHKMVPTGQMVETPWAMSVMVSNNEAALATSKSGRRLIVGPRTELLQYEEWLEVLGLSTGRPKTDARILETCFLRVTGNRIGDVIELETADFVPLKVEVSYGVEFVGKSEEDRIKWFNHRDYVGLLCTGIRSRLRAAARSQSFAEIYPKMAEFVRDTILGKKPAAEGEHRPGLLFPENNMLVFEVEVLSAVIPDSEVADIFTLTNRTIVTTQLNETAESVKMEAARRTAEREEEKAKLAKQKIERDKLTVLATIGAKSEQDAETAKLAHRLALQQRASADELNEKARVEKRAAEESRLALEKAAADQDAKTLKAQRESVLAFREALAKIQKDLVGADADSFAKKLAAVQPALIKAIEGLGDKQALTALADKLPQATGELGFLLGSGGIAGLKKMVEGTPFGNALTALTSTLQEVTAQTKVEGDKAAGDRG